eukprot:15456385-Alexandrium_andersonii.AAC.1
MLARNSESIDEFRTSCESPATWRTRWNLADGIFSHRKTRRVRPGGARQDPAQPGGRTSCKDHKV